MTSKTHRGGKKKEPAPEPVFLRTIECRGGCGRRDVPILQAICPPCLDELPAELRGEFDAAHARFNVVERWAVEDRAGQWLWRNRNPHLVRSDG